MKIKNAVGLDLNLTKNFYRLIYLESIDVRK